MIFSILLVSSLACNASFIQNVLVDNVNKTALVGTDLTYQHPVSPEGDEKASKHVFVHNYPMPNDGTISGVMYRNDTDEVPETITLLLLHPVSGGWRIIHTVSLPEDDLPPAISGLVTLALDPPLPVEKGDLFAHWQPEGEPTGPIPFNPDGSSHDGLSIGKFGFNLGNVEPGETIPNAGFTGQRDYFLNVIFKPSP